jgi:hypothetical protein
MCAWDTTEDDVDRFVADLKRLGFRFLFHQPIVPRHGELIFGTRAGEKQEARGIRGTNKTVESCCKISAESKTK